MRYSLLLVFFVLLFAGCSTKEQTTAKADTQTATNTTQSDTDDFDDEFADEYGDDDKNTQATGESCPWLYGYNDTMTSFNDGFYIYLLSPVSKGYETITTEPIRDSIDNFFYNLMYPKRVINNLLQLKFRSSMEETSSFLLNSTFGLLGLFKPAQTMFDIKTHDEDFGQTLGSWGVGAGCHIVLPLLGPSNVRDMFGDFADYYVDPLNPTYGITESRNQYIALRVFKTINESPEKLKGYKLLKKDALYLYPFLKNVYEQFRYNEIQK